MLWKPPNGGFQGGIEAVMKHERFAQEKSPHLISVADIDEFEIVLKAECLRERLLGILFLIEAVDLVQGSFDRETTMTISDGGSTKLLVALENQDLQASFRTKRARG
jgi:hypothetical protein